MPNYFKHHANGKVKQITSHTYTVLLGKRTELQPTDIIIWPEFGGGTSTYDEYGNITSDLYYDYIYDKDGRLIKAVSKNNPTQVQYVKYDAKNKIEKFFDYTFQYGANGQIAKTFQDAAPNSRYSRISPREYEYNPKGQMIGCDVIKSSEYLLSDYDSNGDLTRHVRMEKEGVINVYDVTVTKRDGQNNWTERKINAVFSNSTSKNWVQTREIKYY